MKTVGNGPRAMITGKTFFFSLFLLWEGRVPNIAEERRGDRFLRFVREELEGGYLTLIIIVGFHLSLCVFFIPCSREGYLCVFLCYYLRSPCLPFVELFRP